MASQYNPYSPSYPGYPAGITPGQPWWQMPGQSPPPVDPTAGTQYKVQPETQQLLDMRPDWNTLIDAQSGLLKGPYQFDLGGAANLTPQIEHDLSGINVNRAPLNALEERGMSTDTSPWAKLLLQKQQLEEQGQRDTAQKQGAGNLANSWSQLASRGGVSGGERERLAESNMRGTNDILSQIGQQGAGQRLGIQANDYAQNLDILKGLPGQEIAAIQPAQRQAELISDQRNTDLNNMAKQKLINLQGAISGIQGGNAASLQAYQEAMKAWGAEKQAQATSKSGKK